MKESKERKRSKKGEESDQFGELPFPLLSLDMEQVELLFNPLLYSWLVGVHVAGREIPA